MPFPSLITKHLNLQPVLLISLVLLLIWPLIFFPYGLWSTCTQSYISILGLSSKKKVTAWWNPFHSIIVAMRSVGVSISHGSNGPRSKEKIFVCFMGTCIGIHPPYHHGPYVLCTVERIVRGGGETAGTWTKYRFQRAPPPRLMLMQATKQSWSVLERPHQPWWCDRHACLFN
jgi:hypothetical protein